MAEDSTIEWTDHTFNPWEGCQKVGPGCDNCYAENRNIRFSGGVNWGPGAQRRRTSKANWKKPLKWQREAKAFIAEHGRKPRVFCASLADVFDNSVDEQWRRDLFALIEQCPDLDWLLLTKRIGNVKDMLADCGIYGDLALALPQVALGITVVNQDEANRDIPKLLSLRARTRFLSMEPLLGPVDLEALPSSVDRRHSRSCLSGPGTEWGQFVDWVIVGGESGPNARPMHPVWARDLRDQCARNAVPFLFKQWGEWLPISWEHAKSKLHLTLSGKLVAKEDCDENRDFPGQGLLEVQRVGKKLAGRRLDGELHDGFPESMKEAEGK